MKESTYITNKWLLKTHKVFTKTTTFGDEKVTSNTIVKSYAKVICDKSNSCVKRNSYIWQVCWNSYNLKV